MTDILIQRGPSGHTATLRVECLIKTLKMQREGHMKTETGIRVRPYQPRIAGNY